MSETDKNKKTVEAYDKNAKFYAERFDSYGARTVDVDRALKLNESGSSVVLELGCGNGRDAEYIVSKVGVGNYIGIDASQGLITLAREKVPNAMFHVKDMRNTENNESVYSVDKFGVIFSFASLLHMKREEMAQIIEKCRESLKIGGILYITSKYGEYKEIEIENLGDKKYYYSYTPEEVKQMAGKGFAVVYSVIQDSSYGPEFVMSLKSV